MNNSHYEFHEYANIFPLIEGDDFDALVTSVEIDGLHEPIWLYEGKILDGRNRYLACVKAEIEPVFQEYTGDNPLSFVILKNRNRRDMSPSQRACSALRLLPHFEILARERQRGGRGGVLLSEKIQQANGRAAEFAGDVMGVNYHYIYDAKKVQEEAPELFDVMFSGGLHMKEALHTIHERERQQKLDELRADIENGIAVLPEGVFEIISLDPPWPYGTKYDASGRRAASPYPEMSLEEIRVIELPAADDCILWLWTTHKFMRYSFDLLDAWGFRDVAILTWEKDQMGLGQWLRSQTEFCIMAVKGKPQVDLTNQTTILHGKVREHSRKPEEFYQMVDALCIGRKLDYFSREARKGWSQYGSELGKFD